MKELGMDNGKKVILVLTAQSVVLGFGLGNALWHPSVITVGGAIFMAALLPVSIYYTFRTVAAL